MTPINPYIFEHFPVLKTERLTLRQFLPGDANAVFEMRINPNVNRFISRGPIQNIQEAEKLVQKVTDSYQEKLSVGWAVLLRERNKIIGGCGFNKIDFASRRAEIGGEMHPDYWGKNIAFEAVKEIVRFGLNEMNLHTIEAWVWPQNRSVVYLLEKLGFKKEAHLTDYVLKDQTFTDMAIYILHKKWFKTV
ncbi:MAG: N-acetyltransferase [Sphingobacteriales bacterium]|nr:MAG: N-acetyltransferase [Sphingobacteriales bacterium]